MTLEEAVDRLVGTGLLTHATLSGPRRRGANVPRRLTVRPVVLRGERRYQWTAHFATRTADENLDAAATRERLLALLGPEYRQGLLQATDADLQVLAGGRSVRVVTRPATRPAADLRHDRRKRYLLDEGTPVPFLVELGVMTPGGAVRARRHDKFRQVNRFLELVEDVLPALPEDDPLRVVDFGSGRSYLTFALHHLLVERHGRRVELLGLDLKEDVVAECAALAARLGAAGLRFEVGDIAGYQGVDGADLVVSLHACDTATDEALARAVDWEAAVILAVPCCQHELLPQLDNPSLAPLLRHGVLRERFAAEVTDAARAQLLGLAGYDVQLVEFVELEHTPKNVLIRATRRPGRDTARLAREYAELKRSLGFDHALERLLGDRIAVPA
ncbi:MAG TPA: SAM-dependent methyltransferase [Gaiellaceae bacterium]|nr:SAM-dependent methyltransferase [Gaiellaceae bacterium]